MQSEFSKIIGFRAISEAIDKGKGLDRVFIKKDLSSDNAIELIKLCRENDILVSFVPIEKLNRLSGKNHQGVIAFTSPIEFVDIDYIITESFNKGKDPLVFLLDGVTDVRNFGAILRTCECAGVDLIIVPEKGSAAIGEDTAKTSAGALFKIPIARVKNIAGTIKYLKNFGLISVGATEKAEQVLYETNLTGPLAIVMGNEEVGLSNEVIRTCDYIAKIPMKGTLNSLNVSVAAGLFAFETVRQKSL